MSCELQLSARQIDMVKYCWKYVRYCCVLLGRQEVGMSCQILQHPNWLCLVTKSLWKSWLASRCFSQVQSRLTTLFRIFAAPGSAISNSSLHTRMMHFSKNELVKIDFLFEEWQLLLMKTPSTYSPLIDKARVRNVLEHLKTKQWNALESSPDNCKTYTYTLCFCSC